MKEQLQELAIYIVIGIVLFALILGAALSVVYSVDKYERHIYESQYSSVMSCDKHAESAEDYSICLTNVLDSRFFPQNRVNMP